MKCKEAEKLIVPFISEEIETRDLEEFLIHIEECEQCREELSIQYLVAEGLQRLEEGSTFDLQSELENRLDFAQSRIRLRNILFKALYTIEILTILAVIGIAVYVIIF